MCLLERRSLYAEGCQILHAGQQCIGVHPSWPHVDPAEFKSSFNMSISQEMMRILWQRSSIKNWQATYRQWQTVVVCKEVSNKAARSGLGWVGQIFTLAPSMKSTGASIWSTYLIGEMLVKWRASSSEGLTRAFCSPSCAYQAEHKGHFGALVYQSSCKIFLAQWIQSGLNFLL